MEIRRPKDEDINELTLFFEKVILDTFKKEGLADKLIDIQAEMEGKKNYLKCDFDSKGKNRFFLIALDGNKIIGSIEHGPASNLINLCTNGALKDVNEIGTVFVHPDYQRKGLGNSLLQEMYETLQRKGIDEFCLDSGYKSAQRIWKKKFGQPDYFLKNYWGEGSDHMIWKVKISDL